MEAKLNALLGRKTTAKVPKITLPPAKTLKRTVTQLVRWAAQNRPLLAKWRKRIRVEQLRRKLAQTGYLPDLGVSVSYRYRQDSGADPVQGMDFWSLGVAICIPLWSISATAVRNRHRRRRDHGDLPQGPLRREAATSVAEVREATLEAGMKRVRPCLMMAGTTLLALLPVLTSSGRGADIMVPMAIPSFGGMLIQIMTMLIVPVLYSAIQEMHLKHNLGMFRPPEGSPPESGAELESGRALPTPKSTRI